MTDKLIARAQVAAWHSVLLVVVLVALFGGKPAPEHIINWHPATAEESAQWEQERARVQLEQDRKGLARMMEEMR